MHRARFHGAFIGPRRKGGATRGSTGVCTATTLPGQQPIQPQHRVGMGPEHQTVAHQGQGGGGEGPGALMKGVTIAPWAQ